MQTEKYKDIWRQGGQVVPASYDSVLQKAQGKKATVRFRAHFEQQVPMIIGIISDTHDNLDNLGKTLDLFKKRGAEHIIHAGDYTSPFTYRVLKHFAGGFTGIFGNNDGDKVLLNTTYQGRIFTQPHIFRLHNRKIVVMHEPAVVEALADSGHFDLIVHGHTHEPVIRWVKSTLIINPGEVSGWLYGRPTAAIVNLEVMEAEILDII